MSWVRYGCCQFLLHNTLLFSHGSNQLGPSFYLPLRSQMEPPDHQLLGLVRNQATISTDRESMSFQRRMTAQDRTLPIVARLWSNKDSNWTPAELHISMDLRFIFHILLASEFLITNFQPTYFLIIQLFLCWPNCYVTVCCCNRCTVPATQVYLKSYQFTIF